jgi:VIT1/CCC1 family predicted Fe2+/Mn2+ transporter
VTGGALSHTAILIVGAANLAADGLSMGVGNYLAIRAHESALRAERQPAQESRAWRHGLATLLAFISAGALPLAPFVFPAPSGQNFTWSVVLTLAALFGVGAARGAVTADHWLKTGLEMFSLGVVVAGAAYGAGLLAASLAG